LSPKNVAQTPRKAAADGPTPPPAAGPSERTRRFLTELLPVLVGLGVGAVVYFAYGGPQPGAGGTLVLTDSLIIGAVVWFAARLVLRRIVPRPPAA
jgi:hypothetical protein